MPVARDIHLKSPTEESNTVVGGVAIRKIDRGLARRWLEIDFE